MTRIYHKCHFCGGKVVEEEEVTVDYRWGKELLTIIKNVPAGVCQICGEQYFKAEVVKEMEKLAHSKAKARAIIKVPVQEMGVPI